MLRPTFRFFVISTFLTFFVQFVKFRPKLRKSWCWGLITVFILDCFVLWVPRPVSNFFLNANNLKALQKQKQARLGPKIRFSHAAFQNLLWRFWASSSVAKLQVDFSRDESRKIEKSHFGNFTQTTLVWALMFDGGRLKIPKMAQIAQGLWHDDIFHFGSNLTIDTGIGRKISAENEFRTHLKT